MLPKVGASGSDDDLLSRFKGLKEAAAPLVQYTYFGVDTFCEQEYPENAVKLTYIDSNATGDPYVGLDRGACPVRAGRRVVDQRWHKGSTDLERLKYAGTCPGRAGARTNNRTERDNTVGILLCQGYGGHGGGPDEQYAYAEPAKSGRSESGGKQTAGSLSGAANTNASPRRRAASPGIFIIRSTGKSWRNAWTKKPNRSANTCGIRTPTGWTTLSFGTKVRRAAGAVRVEAWSASTP